MAKAPIHALDYLQSTRDTPVPPVCVAFGNEPLLKREVLAKLKRTVLGDSDPDLVPDRFAGPAAEPFEVFDTLRTRNLFSPGQRLVVVEEADPFVTAHRAALEDYVASPADSGVLVLDVGTWSKTTRLAKRLAEEAGLQIDCKRPAVAQLCGWLTQRAKREYGVKLASADADMMLEMVTPSLGLLDQELARLALLTGPDRVITGQMVREHVGGWRVRSAWDLVDAAAEGNAVEALRQLGRLIESGESPIGLLAQIAGTLRRFAAATWVVDHAGTGPPRLGAALERAGVPRFARQKSERQLRQIGRLRGRQLNNWLLAADLALKGVSSSGWRQRFVLEQLIVRLAAAADPRRI
jgi:DNA polymerase III subunit delta